MESPTPLSYLTPADTHPRGFGEMTVVSFTFFAIALFLLLVGENKGYHGSNSMWYAFDETRYWTLHFVVRTGLACSICGLGYSVWSLHRQARRLAPAIVALCLNSIATLFYFFAAIDLYVIVN
jgi:magnesium-transporting ATPase (P-type)